MCAVSLPAAAQPKGKADKGEKGSIARADGNGKATERGGGAGAGAAAADKKKEPKEKTFDFDNLKLNGQLRTPQLLYFLERANEELERASLEKRSFIRHIVRSVEEETL